MTRADRAFSALVGLAIVSSAVLLTLFATLVMRAQQLTHGPSDTADLVAVLVLVLAICGIGLGLGSLARQLLATASLIRSLLRRRVPAPLAVTPPLLAGPGLLVAPASLLFAAAVSGGMQQLRLVTR